VPQTIDDSVFVSIVFLAGLMVEKNKTMSHNMCIGILITVTLLSCTTQWISGETVKGSIALNSGIFDKV